MNAFKYGLDLRQVLTYWHHKMRKPAICLGREMKEDEQNMYLE
jgi:hypothetical protein